MDQDEYHHNFVKKCCKGEFCNTDWHDKDKLRTKLCEHQLNGGHNVDHLPYCENKGI